jgi:hypothetical protein
MKIQSLFHPRKFTQGMAGLLRRANRALSRARGGEQETPIRCEGELCRLSGLPSSFFSTFVDKNP